MTVLKFVSHDAAEQLADARAVAATSTDPAPFSTVTAPTSALSTTIIQTGTQTSAHTSNVSNNLQEGLCTVDAAVQRNPTVAVTHTSTAYTYSSATVRRTAPRVFPTAPPSYMSAAGKIITTHVVYLQLLYSMQSECYCDKFMLPVVINAEAGRRQDLLNLLRLIHNNDADKVIALCCCVYMLYFMH